VDRNQLGCLAEYKFSVKAIEEGFNVSMPLLDSSPYDCIIERDLKLYKIQIKNVSPERKFNRDSIHLVLRRTTDFYTKEEVDFFAIYIMVYEGFFIIPNYQQRSIRLSIDGKYKDNFNNFALIK
jgi:hypothetical protein